MIAIASVVALVSLAGAAAAYGRCAGLRAMIVRRRRRRAAAAAADARAQLNEDKKCCAYTLQGKRHVGIGLNLDRASAAEMRAFLATVGADFDDVYAGRECLNEDQIDRLHDADVAVYEGCMQRWFGTAKWNTFSADQQSAVIDLAYTVGCAGARGFPSMKAAMEAGEWQSAAYHLSDSVWCRDQAPCRCQRNTDCLSPGYEVGALDCSQCNCGGDHPDPDFCDPTPMPTPGPSRDCVVSQWSSVTCTDTCSSNGATVTRTRTRTVTTTRIGTGVPCPELEEEVPCTPPPCKDCVQVTGSCGECNSNCPDTFGMQTCTRVTIQQPENGGRGCLPGTFTELCFNDCPVDCVEGAWSCGGCSAVCNGNKQVSGERYCTRPVLEYPQNGGKQCEQLYKWEPCTKDCPVPCEVGDWSCLTCPRRCSASMVTCTRPVLQQPANGGSACPETSATEPCEPVCDCELSDWECEADCFGGCGTNKQGSKFCTRDVAKAPTGGGLACPSNTFEVRTCTLPTCPPVPPPPRDCEVSDEECSECNAACEALGKQVCTRNILVTPRGSGAQCPALSYEKSCTGKPCPVPPVDCEWSPWICGACNVKCGETDKMQCTRRKRVLEKNGGKPCTGAVSKMESCSGPPCDAVNCLVANWAEWSECSTTCGTGSQVRQRAVVREAAHSGLPCGDLHESKRCSGDPCSGDGGKPSDCVMSEWAAWSPCSASCAAGARTGEKVRRRTIVKPAAHNGKSCGALLQQDSCRISCPGDGGGNGNGNGMDGNGMNGGGGGGGGGGDEAEKKRCIDSRGYRCDPEMFATAEFDLGGVQCGCGCRDKDSNPCLPETLIPKKRKRAEGAWNCQCLNVAGGKIEGGMEPPVFFVTGGDEEGVLDSDNLPIIIGASVGGVCCLLIMAAIIFAVCAARSGPASTTGTAFQPSKDQVVEGNPLFQAQENKVYNPIFYSTGDNVPAGGGSIGGASNYPGAGSSYGGDTVQGMGTNGGYVDALPGMVAAGGVAGGVAAASAANYPTGAAASAGGAFTCNYCGKGYPTDADMQFHLQKRTGEGAHPAFIRA